MIVIVCNCKLKLNFHLFRYAALDSIEKNSTPESYFEALEVRGLPDTPSKNELFSLSCIQSHFCFIS